MHAARIQWVPELHQKHILEMFCTFLGVGGSSNIFDSSSWYLRSYFWMNNRLEVPPLTNFCRLPGKMFNNWRKKLLRDVVALHKSNGVSMYVIRKKTVNLFNNMWVKHTPFSIFCQKCRDLRIFLRYNGFVRIDTWISINC